MLFGLAVWGPLDAQAIRTQLVGAGLHQPVAGGLGRWAGRGATGLIAFERLPSGAWVIRKWFIRAPIPRLGVRPGVIGGVVTVGPTDTLGVGGYREEGALVTVVLCATGRPVAVYPEEP